MKVEWSWLKRWLAMLICAAMTVSAAAVIPAAESPGSMTVQAADALSAGDYKYELTDSGTVRIMEYTGTAAFVSIPERLAGKTVTEIADDAFRGSNCRNIKEVFIPATIQSVYDTAAHGIQLFVKCDNLTKISVASDNPVFSEVDGVLYNKDGSSLLACPIAKTNIVQYHEKLKTIMGSAFENSKMTSISLPSGVKTICLYAFRNAQLSHIDLPVGLDYITMDAFINCRNLKEITVPKTIRNGADILDEGMIGCGLGFMKDDNDKVTKISGFKMYGYAGSAAEKYASSNNLTFIRISSLVNKSTVSQSVIAQDTAVSCNGIVSGGVAPYRYAFTYRLSTSSVWKRIGSKFADNITQESIKFPKAGQYVIRIEAKDAMDETATIDLPLTVYAPLENNSNISTGRVDPGKAVTVSARAKNGAPPYYYTFRYRKHLSGSWTVSGQENQTSAANQVVLPEEGVYDIRVTIKDKQKNTVSRDYVVYASDSSRKVDNAASSVSAARIDPGAALTATASAKYGYAPYKHAFYYKKAGASGWTLFRGYSEEKKVTMPVFSQEGQYIVLIKTKDTNGDTSSKEVRVYVSDSSRSLENQSTFPVTRVDPSQSFTVTAKGAHGYAPYQYAFYYKKASANSWITCGNGFQDSEKRKVTLKTEGTYDFMIEVRDAKGTIKQKQFRFYISDSNSPVTNVSKISAARADPKQSVVVSALAKGGLAPYSYSYYFRKDGDATWTSSGSALQKSDSRVMTFTSEGKYKIRVDVIDAAKKTVSKEFTLYISDSKTSLANNSVLSENRVDPDQALTATAKASHGYAPYTYAFYYRKNNTGTWTLSGKEFQTSDTRQIKLTSEGMYEILIKVKDAKGSVVNKKQTVYVSDSAKALTNLSKISVTRADPGQPIVLTAAAKAGYAPYTYSYYYRENNAGDWKLKGNAFQSAVTFQFNLTNEGKYGFKVVAKDSKGQMSEKYFTAYVSDSKTALANDSVLSADRVDPGQVLTATAKAKHGYAPYTYAFYYRKDNTGDWKLSGKEYRNSDTNDFKFTAEGKYGILVKVKDAKGKTASAKFVIYVSDSKTSLTNQSVLSATRVDPAQALTATAKAKHGYAPYTYAFYYRKDNTGDWKLSGTEYKNSNTNDFKFTAEGKYGILVKVKDAKGQTASAKFVIYVSDSKTSLTNQAVLSATRVDPAQVLTATAKARHGYAPYTYAFYYSKDNTGDWKLSGTEYKNSNTNDFKFTYEGKYGILVKVKDAKGQTASAKFVIYVSDSKSYITNRSTISTVKPSVKEKITITGKATGGCAPYTYAFDYCKGNSGEWKLIGKEFKNSNTSEVSFSAKGTYSVRVRIKDTTGSYATKVFTVNVQ